MNPSLAMPLQGVSLEELTEFVGEQMQRLNLVLKSLDGLNIVDIKFELQGGAYLQFNRKGLVFFDGENETMKVGVDGKAVLTGVEIQSANGAYPRVSMSSSGKLFGAYKSETDSIVIHPDFNGSPALIFDNDTAIGIISNAVGQFIIHGVTGTMVVRSNGDMEMQSGGRIGYEAWSDIYSHAEAKTLKQELDSIKSRLSQLEGP